MKKQLGFLAFFLLGTVCCNAQIFWTENFESGSTSGIVAGVYTGPNGPWTTMATALNDFYYNPWYVSCAENGHTAGVCGTGCVPVSATATLSTLHVGAATGLPGGDMGASYLSGGIAPYNSTTNQRAMSPTINCTAKYTITLHFYYIENGDGSNDDGSVWYSPDNGTSWSMLVNTAKTPLTCSPQGQWAAYSIALPASANNNPNVKIGFEWTNNDDGVGTDPSYAIDSVSLIATPGGAPTAAFTTNHTTICTDSSVTFTNTSTGTVDSFRWTIPGVTIATPTVSPVTITFTTAGTYNAKLKIYSGAIRDSVTHVITVNQSPHPVITKAGHVLSVAGSYTSYQWYNLITPIVGATNSTYTYTVNAAYGVLVDSGGCMGLGVFSTLGVTPVTGSEGYFWIASSGNENISLYTSQPLDESLSVTIHDITGRKIVDEQWSKGDITKNINASALPPGLYFIRLSNRDNYKILRWAKE